jgi:hypothetical protein
MFLRTFISPAQKEDVEHWIPESAVFMKIPPRYLIEAKRIGLARRIATALRVDRPEIVRERLLERHYLFGASFPRAGWPPNPFEDDMQVIHTLGSVG